jgi:putative MATE family efflux protein
VDRIFIGKGMGTEALAGVSLIFPIMTIIVGLEVLVSVGAGVLISIKLGERNKLYAQKILGNTLTIYFIFALIATILGFAFMKKILLLCGASEITLPFAKEYFMFLLPCFFFQFMSMGLNNIVRAESNIKTAMITILISTMTNIILDPIFIFTLKMGVKGAAIATDIGMINGAIWIFWHFRKSKHRVLSLHFKNLKLEKNLIMEIFEKGFSPFFMQIITSIISIIMFNTLYKYGGDTAIGAMGIVNTIFFFVLLIIIGLSQGCQPVTGFNFGAKNYQRLTEVMFYSIMLGLCITIPAFILIQLFGKHIVNIFCKNDLQLLTIATRGLKMLLFCTYFVGFNVTTINFFLAIGKSKLAMTLNTLRQVVLFIPALIFLPKYFALDGIWYIYPFIDTITFIIIFFFFYKYYKIFKNLAIQQQKI